MNINIKLFNFQKEAIEALLSFTNNSNKQVITVKSPTGSGKTIILINYIKHFLQDNPEKFAFIWFCPGKGNLEEQSQIKMEKVAPSMIANDLFESLNNGFTPNSTTFINWELVTKAGNKALLESEKKNLRERIEEAKTNNISFIIIIDEEHANNTSKANTIIEYFNAKHIIRMSATADKNSCFEYFEIPEEKVIEAGLITRFISVNEGIENSKTIHDEYDKLIELANNKRIEVQKEYDKLGKKIRPLVLIQFPNARPDAIKQVEEKLNRIGYSYENGLVAKWTSDNKINLEDIVNNDATPIFLLMKQAISTGWDCPRAKILIKLREGMDQNFEIQTIGRIRRMPEARHYDNDILDYCYIYTFDEKWKNGLICQMRNACETRRLFLKEKCKTFTLQKEIRNNDIAFFGEREVCEKIYNYYFNEYKIDSDFNKNKIKLSEKRYIFHDKVVVNTLSGKFVNIENIEKNNANITETKVLVDAKTYSIEFSQVINGLKNILCLEAQQTKTILERLFQHTKKQVKYRILNLNKQDFKCFVINNRKKIEEDFRKLTAKIFMQNKFNWEKRLIKFNLPEQDLFKYDLKTKRVEDIRSNAYKGYTTECITSKIRSISEQLFEQFCERQSNIEWVYKNGDAGQRYFSIVYLDYLNNQWLFYPDYIIKKTDGTIWIIEAKGGESAGRDKNIDKQIGNKFDALKQYAELFNKSNTTQKLKWGFVRDVDNSLYINNTEFVIDMNDDKWEKLIEVF